MSDPCIRYRPPGAEPSGIFTGLSLAPQCVAPGQHLPGCGDCLCACHGPTRPDHDDPSCDGRHVAIGCAGCAPRPAERGRLCFRDWRTLADLLGDREGVTINVAGKEQPGPHGITWIYSWLGENVEPSTELKETIAEIGGAPAAAAHVGIIDLRTEVYQQLAMHVAHARELLGLQGTGPRSTVYARSSWLLDWLDPITNLPMVEGLWSDLTDWASRSHALAPWRAKARLITARMCPVCHQPGTMIVFGGEVDVQCGSCRAVIDSDRWELWEKALRVRARLEPVSVPAPRRGLRGDQAADETTPGSRA